MSDFLVLNSAGRNKMKKGSRRGRASRSILLRPRVGGFRPSFRRFREVGEGVGLSGLAKFPAGWPSYMHQARPRHRLSKALKTNWRGFKRWTHKRGPGTQGILPFLSLGAGNPLAQVIPTIDLMGIGATLLGVGGALMIPKQPWMPEFAKSGWGKYGTQLLYGVAGNALLTMLMKRRDLGCQFFNGAVAVVGAELVDRFLLNGALGLATPSIGLGAYVESPAGVSSVGTYVDPPAGVSSIGAYVDRPAGVSELDEDDGSDE